MARNNSSTLILVGAILGLVFAIASMFVEVLGFFNVSVVTDSFLGGGTSSTWYNAFWGYYDMQDEKIVYFSENATEVIYGVLIVVGAVLCLTRQRALGLVGSILMLVGILLWGIALVDHFTQLLKNIGVNPENYTIFDMFVGSKEYDMFLFSVTVKWNVGIGFYGCTIGAILALVGAIQSR